MATTFVVTGDQYRIIDRRMREIKRQLDQDGGSPLSPELVAQALQGIIEGQSEAKDFPIRDFFITLLDEDADQQIVAGWRQLANDLGYEGPVVWRVQGGFTLKKHAPEVGPCYENFGYLQNWDFEDKPTEDSLVFWIPRLVPGSVNSNVKEQMELLAEAREKYHLPEHHLSCYSSASFLAGLILNHYQTTQERVPLDHLWVRTDTLRADGYRLSLGYFDGLGLYCYYWDWDDNRHDSLGCFPLGVETLGG